MLRKLNTNGLLMLLMMTNLINATPTKAQANLAPFDKTNQDTANAIYIKTGLEEAIILCNSRNDLALAELCIRKGISYRFILQCMGDNSCEWNDLDRLCSNKDVLQLAKNMIFQKYHELLPLRIWLDADIGRLCLKLAVVNNRYQYALAHAQNVMGTVFDYKMLMSAASAIRHEEAFEVDILNTIAYLITYKNFVQTGSYPLKFSSSLKRSAEQIQNLILYTNTMINNLYILLDIIRGHRSIC